MTAQRSATRSSWELVPLGLFLLDCFVACVVLKGEPRLDETVFFPAALAFAKAGVWPGAELLRHYDAPQTPLALYLAGRVLALVPSLRLLRVLDAALMAFGAWRLLRFARERCEPRAWLLLVLVGVNPYFHLAATHFYTDAAYFALVAVLVTRERERASTLNLAALPLVRQFGVIFPIGRALSGFRRRRWQVVLSAVLALVPTLLLFAFWGGLAPESPRAEIAKSVHRVYGPIFPYVATYHVAALGFYLAPALVWTPRSRWFWGGAFAAAVAYALAPAHPNFSALLAGAGITTLGLVQRIACCLGGRGGHALLCLFAACGGALIGEALRWRSELGIFVALFVLGSTFNFQAWDKYLLDVIPIVFLAIFAARTEVATRRA